VNRFCQPLQRLALGNFAPGKLLSDDIEAIKAHAIVFGRFCRNGHFLRSYLRICAVKLAVKVRLPGEATKGVRDEYALTALQGGR